MPKQVTKKATAKKAPAKKASAKKATTKKASRIVEQARQTAHEHPERPQTDEQFRLMVLSQFHNDVMQVRQELREREKDDILLAGVGARLDKAFATLHSHLSKASE